MNSPKSNGYAEHDGLPFRVFSASSLLDAHPVRQKKLLTEKERARTARVRRLGACNRCRQGKRRVCRYRFYKKAERTRLRCPSVRMSRVQNTKLNLAQDQGFQHSHRPMVSKDTCSIPG
jgi:hypothetical protein